MADDNGSGSAGGNTSVVWSVRHGRRPNNPKQLKAVNGGMRHAARGQVLIDRDTVRGHTDDAFAAIGSPEHPRMFRVRLRFKSTLLPMLDARDSGLVKQYGHVEEATGDVYLTVHVPAIERPQPGNDEEWEDTPWEIAWEW